MTEKSEPKLHRPKRDDAADASKKAELTETEPFTPEEAARMSAIRDQVQHGEINEWMDDYRRLLFARWLYEHGDLES